jgi:hypothetical protein
MVNKTGREQLRTPIALLNNTKLSPVRREGSPDNPRVSDVRYEQRDDNTSADEHTSQNPCFALGHGDMREAG